MNIKKKRFSLLIASFTISLLISAQQTGTDSPYGRYGYGLLSNPGVGATEAMGGISYGLRRSQNVNPGNPASYSVIDSLTFILDFGLSGHLVNMDDGTNGNRYYNANLDYIAMQFPLFRNMGASIGLLPYSKVGYNFGTARSLQNIQYLETYRGTGGLSQIYFGTAWEPIKHLSLGANVAYLFGSFSHSSVITPYTLGSLIGETKQSFSIRDLKYDLGIQLSYPMTKTKSVTLGAIYSPRINTKANLYHSEMLYEADPYVYPTYDPYQILLNDTLQGMSFQLPQTFGLGLTYQTRNLLIGMDGTYQQWKNAAYPKELDGLENAERFNDFYRLSAGTEYVKDPYSQKFFHRIRFRGGLSYSNSYTNFAVNKTDGGPSQIGGYNEYGVTLGVGLPFHDLRTGYVSMFNIALSYIRQQPELKYMIRQDMFKISININVNELWFFKHQFN